MKKMQEFWYVLDKIRENANKENNGYGLK